MCRKNNKGFTMTEILAAIIIMGVLLMLVVPGVSRLMKNFRNNYYKELEETVTASAKDFYSDNKIYRPDGLLKSSYTSVSSLIDKKYVEKLNDYKGKSCSLDESYVVVIYRGEDNYEYKACLKCANDDYQSDTEGTYCDPAWLTNDNLKYDYGDTEDVYIYKNTTREEVREKLLKNLNIVKYNTKGEELDRVVLAEGMKEDLLPNDIDELDTSIIDIDTNMKETILHYNIDNQTEELKVVVYKHQEPKVEFEDANGNEYTPGAWTNKLILKLSKNDDFFELSNTSVANYQWSIDGGEWTNIDCQLISSGTCSVTIQENVDANYRFRIVTNEGRISDETMEYSIRVDVDKPTVSISPNGSEPIVLVGDTTGNVSFSLTTNDTGGSNIKTRKYAVSTSSTTAPTTFTSFYNNTLNYSNDLTGNKYYVWAQVEDNAGNISTGVWSSNVFHMKYEVIYDANGGTGTPAKAYKKHGTNLTLSSTTPTRTGYKFAGWSTTSTGDVVYSKGATYSDDKSIRLYAVWTPNVLTINYYSNYATSSFSETLNAVGANKNVLVRTTYQYYDTAYPDGLWNYSTSGSSTYLARTGYAATGKWGTSTSGGTLVDENTSFASGQAFAKALGYDLSQGDVTVNVYAQWTENKLTVNHYNGSSYIKSVEYYYDDNYPDGLWAYSTFGISKTGYTGTNKWKTSDGTYVVHQSTAFSSGQALAKALGKDLSSGNASVNVYAVWTANVLTINYYSNYATSSFSGALNAVGASKNVIVRTTTHAYDTAYTDGLWNYSTSGSSTYLARTGYVATGKWGTSTSGGTLVDENTSFASGQAFAEAFGKSLASGNATVNVYAQWKVNNYTVTYNANGGSVSPTSASASPNTNVTLPTPTRSGYIFKGWYTSSSGGTYKGVGGNSYKVEANITLYAQWASSSHTCNNTTRASGTASVSKSNVLTYWGVNSYNHWCTNDKTTESCIPSKSGDTIAMYEVTCKICGKKSGSKWCPVHGAGGSSSSGGGGKTLEICDASAKKYSSGATDCIGKKYPSLGWTQVSK